MKFICGIAIALLSFMPIAMADEFVPPSFSQGFEMLNALGPGLPDKTAKWIKLEARGTHQSNVLRELSDGMQGNAWLLPATGDDTPMAIHFGNTAPRKTETGDAPPEGDLEKDTARIIEAIAKVERVDDLENFRRPWSDGGARTFGPLMIFAAQLHHAGHPKLADQLAWALFQAAPARVAVIDAALNHLGDELYNHATERFFENHDWQAYHVEITSLVEKLPRGWENQPAAILALEAINLRINNPSPPKPEFDGLTITAEAHSAIEWMTREPETEDSAPTIPPELAAMLAQIPPEYHARFLEHHGHAGAGNSIPNPGFWIISTPESLNNTGPAAEILALGIEAIPVLAALATDSYPTHFQNPGASRGGFSYSRSAATRALENHASMIRPATRGDIARMLLSAILPDAQGRIRRAEPHVIQDAAIDFYRTHKSKDTGELAAVYLGEGDEMQKTQAADFLAKSPDPRHHAIFENHILNSSPATANLQAVITYSQQRKIDAKPFLDKYLPLIRDEIGDGSDVENDRNLHWQFRQPGQINQTLRQLEAIAEGKSPIDSAREIAQGPPEEAAPAIQALLRNLASESPETHLEILLAGALATENAQIRFTFLTPMLGMRNHFASDHDDDDDDDDAQQAVPDAIREAWAVFSRDDRAVETEWHTNTYFSADTIAEFAAMALEARLNAGGIFELYEATGILRQPLSELCMARINARMTGEALPPLPDPEKVSEERLREIVTEAGNKPATEIITFLDSLTPDERAAWVGWMEDPDEIEIPESVRELAFTVTDQNTHRQEGLIPTPGLLNLSPGLQIHEDTIDAYIADLAKNHGEHSLSMGTLNQSDFPPGLTAWTLRAEIPNEDEPDNRQDRFLGGGFTPLDFFRQFIEFFMDDGMPDNAEALIVIQLYSDHSHLMFQWWVVDGKPAAFAMDDSGNMTDEVPNTLPEAIATIRKTAQIQNLLIQVLSREHAEKIANL